MLYAELIQTARLYEHLTEVNEVCSRQVEQMTMQMAKREGGSTEEHLTVTQFKVEQEQERLARIQDAAAYAIAETQRRNEEMEETRKKARQAKAQLDAVVPKVETVEELARRYSDDVDKVPPEAGALETARSYREKKAKPLYKKIVGVLRALYNKYLDLINSFAQKVCQVRHRTDTVGEANPLTGLVYCADCGK